MKKFRYLIVLMLSCLFIFTACGNDTTNEQNNPANDNTQTETGNNEAGESLSPAVVEKAEAVFSKSCIQCHGSDLQGRMGEQSNLQTVGARLSRDEIETTIREGGNQMPAFEGRISEDEIDVLAEWLAAKK